MKKYSLDFDRIEGVGLTCTCTVSGEDMPSPTQKRFHGLNFFRWGEHGAERFIAEYRPATLNKIRLLHLEFEQEKPVATHKSASGAKKCRNLFYQNITCSCVSIARCIVACRWKLYSKAAR